MSDEHIVKLAFLLSLSIHCLILEMPGFDFNKLSPQETNEIPTQFRMEQVTPPKIKSKPKKETTAKKSASRKARVINRKARVIKKALHKPKLNKKKIAEKSTLKKAGIVKKANPKPKPRISPTEKEITPKPQQLPKPLPKEETPVEKSKPTPAETKIRDSQPEKQSEPSKADNGAIVHGNTIGQGVESYHGSSSYGAGKQVLGRQGQDSNLDKEALTSYKDIIEQRIASCRRYPYWARRQRFEGTVYVAFTVLADGQVKDIKIVRSSGFSILDNEAVSMVKRASPFPPIPKELNCSRLKMEVPIVFKLE